MSELDDKILEWIKKSAQLANVKEEEMLLRKELALIVLKENKPEAFSEKLELGKGFFLKATQVLNYKLDEVSKVETVIDKLSEMGKSDVSRDVFKWKPSLSESYYKKLDPDTKSIIDEVLCITIGAPKLEYIEPKKKAE